MSALTEVAAGGDEGTDWGDVHPRKAWFDVRPLADGVFLIAEPGHVNNYLVVGEDRAVLLDTGLGVADIRTVAEGLAGKPLSVVNSHYHFDHSGGNRQFDEIAIHRAGAGLMAEPSPDGLAEGYMAYTAKLIDAWKGYKELDDTYFHLVTADTLVRPLPEGFDPAGYRIVPSTATTLLDDGDRIDLGGRVLEVMHTPGHSPDSICLFDEHDGLLFGGDTINTGPIYAQLAESDVADFARSTARLATLEADVSLVCMCHFGRGVPEPRFLRDVADAFDRLVSGDRSVEFRVQRDCDDDEVREAVFGQCSILVAPAPGRPRH